MLKKYRFALLFFALALASFSCVSKIQSPKNVAMAVGAKNILVEIAKTQADQKKGLSGRENLGENEGMLFDFRDSAEHRPGFWMKDMKFNLDLIWINNNQIIGITANVPAPGPLGPTATYYPPADIDMALEVNAGWSGQNGIRVGNEIKFINYSN